MVEKMSDINYFIEDHKLWWHADIDEDERNQRIVQLVDRIRDDQQYIERDNLDHLKLYIKRGYMRDHDGNIKVAGADARIGSNPLKSAIDTVTAKITSTKPRVMYVTEGGRWDTRRKARKLQKFVDGVFHESGYYRHAARAFKDSGIFGTGFVKWYIENGDTKCERVFPGEIVVDEQSAAMTCPKSLFQVKYVPVESLIAKFPGKQVDILASNIRQNTISASGVVTTLVRVIEGWHLPNAAGSSEGGRHCIVVDGCTLHDEGWKHDFFPFAVMRWNEVPVGYMGSGACEELHGVANEIDYVMEKTQKSMHVNSSAWLMRHISDKMPNDQFDNDIGSVIWWTGEHPPELKINPLINPQFLDYGKWLRELTFQDIGVSEMSATSKKPPGIESGVGLQHLTDQENSRFQTVAENWEWLAFDSAKIVVALNKEYRQGGKSEYRVKFDDGKFAETIKWSEVNISADEYILKKWPTNLLPATPTGRIERVERMIQGGLIDSQTGFMLLDFPDVEAYQSLALASLKNVLWIVDRVIYDDEYIPPKEWYDLETGIRHMQMGMARAEMEGAPEEVLERALEWVAEANDLLNPPPAPATPEELEEQAMMEQEQQAMQEQAMQGLPGPAPEGGPAANMGNVLPAEAGVPIPGGQ